MNAIGIRTYQAAADADNLIISTSLEYSHVDPGVNVCLQGCRCYDIY